MSTLINVRSPYYIKIEPTNPSNTLEYAQMELYIYVGAFQSTPTSAELRYTLTKNPIGTNNFVVFEISELIRDYLEIEFNGDYNSYAVWVRPVFEYKTTEAGVINPTPVDYIGIDGYGYFEQGANYTLTDEVGLMMTNHTLYVQSNYDLHVPVFSEKNTTVDFYCGNELVHTEATAAVTNTDDMIVYAQLENAEDYQDRVETAGGTFVGSTCLTSFMEALESCVTQVVVNTASSSTTVNVYYLDECRYTPHRVTFVNKFGAFQDIWFFKKSVESSSVKGEQYKASIFSQADLSYKTYQHQQQSFLVNGKDSIVMNTGFVNDDYNNVIKELMLSEQIWYLDNGQTIPLQIKTKDVTYKTSNNEKLADYTIEFERAFDIINNIR
jgi:hypothetical protein